MRLSCGQSRPEEHTVTLAIIIDVKGRTFVSAEQWRLVSQFKRQPHNEW